MADDGSTQSENVWPMPKFYFEVKWDSSVVKFQKVSGLDVENEPIEYRNGDNPKFSKISMPGMLKYSRVTMEKGVFTKDNQMWDWFNEVKMNTIKRKPITISLLDEGGSPTMVWTLENAFPARISSTDLNAEGNEVAIDKMEIQHEGLTIANG